MIIGPNGTDKSASVASKIMHGPTGQIEGLHTVIAGVPDDARAARGVPFKAPNVQQFEQLMLLARQLSDKIEREQRETLSRKSKFASQKSRALRSPVVYQS
jgi:ABC-type branched-subunit amino acid transport system ATPase component